MASELKAAGIQVSGATLHFKPGAELPVALVLKCYSRGWRSWAPAEELPF